MSIELDFLSGVFVLVFSAALVAAARLMASSLPVALTGLNFFAFGGGKAIEGIDVRSAEFC